MECGVPFAFLKQGRRSLSGKIAFHRREYVWLPIRTANPGRTQHRSSTDGLHSVVGCDGASDEHLVRHFATHRGDFSEALQQQAIGYGQQNVDAALTFASELANAENLQDALAKQSRYAQMQTHHYNRQTQELTRLISNFTP